MESVQLATVKSRPKLGDFQKLFRVFCDDTRTCSSENNHVGALPRNEHCCRRTDGQIKTWEAVFGEDIKLGDFRKVRRQLRQQDSEPSAEAFSTKTEFFSYPQTMATGQKMGKGGVSCQINDDVGPVQLPGLNKPLDERHVNISAILKNAGQAPTNHTHSKSRESETDSVHLHCSETFQTMPRTEILSYMTDQGPTFRILGKDLSLSEKHKALSVRLVPIRVLDICLRANNHSIALNGVHIFLDMSNINISFQHALRRKYSMGAQSRFYPLPQLNLQFLTEILVRNRKTMALNAGCSVLPDRHEPRFIQELRKLGYRVDLRERRRIAGARGLNAKMSGGACGGPSNTLTAIHTAARFMEDLVDETLQTRIAESVMEYFEHPGTLVLATGDAQPAKYSDGFFTYAERALRMGWYVEVVSWDLSLSSRWRKSSLAQTWGARFRLISLDDFLDELLL